jgi:hypothetical protein
VRAGDHLAGPVTVRDADSVKRQVPVLTAGHTPGHTVYHLLEQGVIVSGDALVTGHPTLRTVGPQLLVRWFDGLSPVGAAAILAETGDPTRFASARAVVKHVGLAPREKLSGTFTGRTKLTGQGRPKLRLAAWRAVWGALQTNTVYAARYRHLSTRETNKLTPTQAQTVIAAAILRHLHAVITTGRAWDPVIAPHGTRGKKETALAA